MPIFYRGVAVSLPSYTVQYSGTALLLLVNPCILHQKKMHHAPHLRIYRLKRRHFVTSYVQPVMQQYESTTVKKNFCYQSSHYENYRRFNGSHHVPTTKLTLFVVNKDEWYTKEGCSKFMKNALFVQRYGKRHLLGWSNIEQQKKIKPVALAIVELRESEGIRQVGRQLVSQSLENSVK